MDDTVSRQLAIDAVMITTQEWDGMYIQDLNCRLRDTLNALPSAQPDNRLARIADLVEGTIDHFDRDDAMDLLYQIKDVIK